jgi:hypothetical protein
MNGKDEESNWDSLASQLGLEPSPRPPAPTRTSPEPSEPPPGETEPRFEKVGEIIPAHVTEIEMKVTAVNDVVELPPTEADFGEDAADVLDDESPETAEETTAEEAAEGEGKGRRRRRRRRRKKGGSEAIVAESTAAIEPEETGEAEVLAFPTFEDEELAEDVSAEAAGEAETGPGEEEEVEEIVPDVALAEEIEDESAEPLPEWKVTAWTDLVATLYRPQDR